MPTDESSSDATCAPCCRDKAEGFGRATCMWTSASSYHFPMFVQVFSGSLEELLKNMQRIRQMRQTLDSWLEVFEQELSEVLDDAVEEAEALGAQRASAVRDFPPAPPAGGAPTNN